MATRCLSVHYHLSNGPVEITGPLPELCHIIQCQHKCNFVFQMMYLVPKTGLLQFAPCISGLVTCIYHGRSMPVMVPLK